MDNAGVFKDKIIKVCKDLHLQGFFPGSTGAIAALATLSANSKEIYLTPEGRKLKDIKVNELYTLRDFYGAQDFINPVVAVKDNSYKVTNNAPIFIELMKTTGAKTVALVHGKYMALASRLALKTWRDKGDALPHSIRLSYYALIDQISPGNTELLLPVINYSPETKTLYEQLSRALAAHSTVPAALIRGHGAFVWADSLEDLESKIEVLERLCELYVDEHNLN